jgi:methyl-accepting chemotaxis protein
MNNVNFSFKKISFFSGCILAISLCGLGWLGLGLQGQIKFNDASSSTTYVYIQYSLFTIGILSFIFSIFAPRLLFKILTPITNGLLKNARDFEATSKELSQFSSQTGRSNETQLEKLHEAAQSIQEMQSSIQKNAENVLTSKKLVSRSKKEALDSQNAIREMVFSIDELNNSQDNIMREISQQNTDLSGIIQIINEINEKTKVINDIVFQTKLLSFNASVEAARAGEHGKGFSVVAQEIGNLAQMSGSASQEISVLLMGSNKKVQEIISNTTSRVEELVSQGREKIQKGSEQAKICEDILTSLTEKVQGMATATDEISVATQDQSSKIGTVNDSIQSLDRSTKASSDFAKSSFSNIDKLFNNSKDLSSVAEILDKIFNFDGEYTSEPLQHKTKSSGFENVKRLTPNRTTNKPSRAVAKKSAEVIPFDQNKKKIPSKNVELKAKPVKNSESKTTEKNAVPSDFSLAVGGNIPHENDPRFEDV